MSIGDASGAHPARWNVGSRDALSGTAVAVAGAVLLFSALSMDVPPSNTEDLGPRAFPIIISGLMTALGVLLVITGARPSKSASAGPPEPALPEGTEHRVSEDVHFVADEMHHVVDEVRDLMEEPAVPFLRLLIVLGIFTAYLMVFIPLGFLISTFLFMATLTSYVAPTKWLRNVLVAAGVTGVVYYAFTELLTVQLPAGLVG